MINAQINFLTIILAALSNVILGFLWYGPILGSSWKSEMKSLNREIKKSREHITKSTFVSLIASLVLACTLYLVLNSTTTSLQEAIITSILIWFGFIASILLNGVLFEGRSVKLYLINSSYYLASLIIMTLIIKLI